jgi:hypothetical protein
MDWLGWAGSGTWGVIERMGSFEPWSTSPMKVRQAGSLGCVGNAWDPRSDREDGFFLSLDRHLRWKSVSVVRKSPSHRLSFTKIMTTTTTNHNKNNNSHGISEFRKKDFLSKRNAVFSIKKSESYNNWNKLIIISITEYMSLVPISHFQKFDCLA